MPTRGVPRTCRTCACLRPRPSCPKSPSRAPRHVAAPRNVRAICGAGDRLGAVGAGRIGEKRRHPPQCPRRAVLLLPRPLVPSAAAHPRKCLLPREPSGAPPRRCWQRPRGWRRRARSTRVPPPRRSRSASGIRSATGLGTRPRRVTTSSASTAAGRGSSGRASGTAACPPTPWWMRRGRRGCGGSWSGWRGCGRGAQWRMAALPWSAPMPMPTAAAG